MKHVGTVEGVAANGSLIVKCNSAPEIGAKIFDEKNMIGITKDIIGPVAEPYMLVKIAGARGKLKSDVCGMKVYTR